MGIIVRAKINKIVYKKAVKVSLSEQAFLPRSLPLFL